MYGSPFSPFGALRTPLRFAFGVASDDCTDSAAIDAKIAALDAAKVPWYKKGHKEWAAKRDALVMARKACTKGSPTISAATMIPVDLSTTSSTLPLIGAAGAFALLALGGIAYMTRPKTNPRRRNSRRRNSRSRR
jgi:hypothetical protein